MALCDVLHILNEGRTLRGSIELNDSLLGWSVRYLPPRAFLIEMDERPLDELISLDMQNESDSYHETFQLEDTPSE